MMILITIICSIAGGIGTFICTEKLKWHPLKSSAILSLIIATPFEIWNLNNYLDIPLIFFGASFVGMSSKDIFNKLQVTIAALLFGCLHFLLSTNFNFIGGTLGTTACLSCLSIVVLSRYSKEAKANL
jgi:hypothetical protein